MYMTLLFCRMCILILLEPYYAKLEAWTGTQRLPRLVGLTKAIEMMLVTILYRLEGFGLPDSQEVSAPVNLSSMKMALAGFQFLCSKHALC